MQSETLFAAGPEGQVGYQVFGEGSVDVLLRPVDVEHRGRAGTATDRALPPPARLLQLGDFDQRGTGVSDPVPLSALATLEEWADDIRVILGREGLDLHYPCFDVIV